MGKNVSVQLTSHKSTVLSKDWPIEVILAMGDEKKKVLRTIRDFFGRDNATLDDGVDEHFGGRWCEGAQEGGDEDDMVPTSMAREVEERMREREGEFDQEMRKGCASPMKLRNMMTGVMVTVSSAREEGKVELMKFKKIGGGGGGHRGADGGISPDGEGI